MPGFFRIRQLRTGVLALALGVAAWAASVSPGAAVSDLEPNLTAMPPFDVQLSNEGGATLLRFSVESWNSGLGPLELFVDPAGGSNGKQNVYQRIYLDDGSTTERLAGSFVWHPDHQHFHFEGYARYTLSAPGLTPRESQKTTFCIFDTDVVNRKLPGAPKKPVYTTCSNVLQGMSVGWGDTYRSYLAGQSIDVTGLPAGVYTLTVDIDPWNRITETEDQADNSASIDIELDIAAGTVTVISGGSNGNGNGNGHGNNGQGHGRNQ